MKFIRKKYLDPQEKRSIMELWNKEYPHSLMYENIQELDAYLSNLKGQNHIFMLNDAGEIKGWYFDFIREEERWFATIVDSTFQGKGFGGKLIRIAMQDRAALNGWVIDSSDYKKSGGKSYKSPLGFYQKMGFLIQPEIKLETEKIKAIKISWKKNHEI